MCTLHNRLATTLIQYETLLIKQLKEKIDKTLHLMITAPLLRLEDNDEGKTIITVNSDNGYVHLLSVSLWTISLSPLYLLSFPPLFLSPLYIHVSVYLSFFLFVLSLSLSLSLSLLQLIEESKAMKQLGVSLSSPAQLLLGQEGRIKQFNQHLQYSVTNLTATIDMIDGKLNPLFHDTIDTVLR